jgi:hypothetical protein
MCYYFLLAEFCISSIHTTVEDALSSHFPEIEALTNSNYKSIFFPLTVSLF